MFFLGLYLIANKNPGKDTSYTMLRNKMCYATKCGGSHWYSGGTCSSRVGNMRGLMTQDIQSKPLESWFT